MFSCGFPGLGAFSLYVLFSHYIPCFWLFLVFFIGTDCLEWSVCASATAFYISFRTWPLHLLTGLLEDEFYVSGLRSAVFSQKAKTQRGLV